MAELRPILIELSDLPLCAKLFQGAFEHYQERFPRGQRNGPGDQDGCGFGLMEVLVLADLYNTLGDHELAVQTIRRGCRWLQGRAEQKYWDMCGDDREFDLSPAGREGGARPGMFPLDVNARHRLAIARIKMGELEEGKVGGDLWKNHH